MADVVRLHILRLTPGERVLIERLVPGKVVYVPSSPDERFARQIQGAAELTARQYEYLRRLGHRYRRQLGGCPVAYCLACQREAARG